MVRAHLEDDVLPWHHAAISGWILDPDRKKMSKSKGNVVVPLDLLERHGSDAVRYWAASGRPGTDTAFDEGQMKIGRRLAIKILNASKFALSRTGGAVGPDAITEPLDLAMLAKLRDVVAAATAALDGYNYTKALEVTETFFWEFCDDYLELVKDRSYADDAGAASAQAALELALNVQLRLFAPFLPFAAEEVWSWWQVGSVHRAAWPVPAELAVADGGDVAVLDATAAALRLIRKAKSEQKLSMRTDLPRVELTAAAEQAAGLRAAARDLAAAGRVQDLAIVEAAAGADITADVTLPAPE